MKKFKAYICNYNFHTLDKNFNDFTRQGVKPICTRGFWIDYRNKCVLNDIELKTHRKNIDNASKIGTFKIKTKNLPRYLMGSKCTKLIDLSFICTHEFLRYFKNGPWYVLKHFPQGYNTMCKFCRDIWTFLL